MQIGAETDQGSNAELSGRYVQGTLFRRVQQIQFIKYEERCMYVRVWSVLLTYSH